MDSNNLYFDRVVALGLKRRPPRDYAIAYASFSKRLLPNGTMLAVGCGDGRDLAYFREHGIPIVGVEPSPSRRALAQRNGIEVIGGAFENLGSLALPKLSGIWCGAALRHVPEDHFGRAIANLADLLPSDAPLFMTLEQGQGANWVVLEKGRDDAQSLDQLYPEAFIERVLREKGLEVVQKWTTELSQVRTGQWISLIALKR